MTQDLKNINKIPLVNDRDLYTPYGSVSAYGSGYWSSGAGANIFHGYSGCAAPRNVIKSNILVPKDVKAEHNSIVQAEQREKDRNIAIASRIKAENEEKEKQKLLANKTWEQKKQIELDLKIKAEEEAIAKKELSTDKRKITAFVPYYDSDVEKHYQIRFSDMISTLLYWIRDDKVPPERYCEHFKMKFTLDEYKMIMEYYALQGNTEYVEYLWEVLKILDIPEQISFLQRFKNYIIKLIRSWL